MANKKGNNYVIDETNSIAKIELHRTKAENLWTIIDLEDLERVISFPYTWFAKYNKPIWNSDADEPDWEVETTNGWSDMYSFYIR